MPRAPADWPGQLHVAVTNFAYPTAKNNEIAALESVRDFLLLSFLNCLFVAVATLAVVQFLKPILRILLQRMVFNRWMVRRDRRSRGLTFPAWLTAAIKPRRFKFADLGSKFHDTKSRLHAGWALLGNALFMRAFQNRAQFVLEHPSDNGRDFELLSADASSDDRGVVFLLDVLGRTDPALVARLTMPPSGQNDLEDGAQGGVSAAIAAAQESIAAASERAIDELQFGLIGTWPFLARFLSVGIAIGIAAYAASSAGVGYLSYPFLIGIPAGLLASLTFDVMKGLVAARER